MDKKMKLFVVMAICCLIYSACNKPTKKRYFYINYRTEDNYSNESLYGSRSFWRNSGFPSQREIDTMVIGALPKTFDCYQHVVVTSLFEFKDSNDFNDFRKGEPPLNVLETKDTCNIQPHE